MIRNFLKFSLRFESRGEFKLGRFFSTIEGFKTLTLNCRSNIRLYSKQQLQINENMRTFSSLNNSSADLMKTHRANKEIQEYLTVFKEMSKDLYDIAKERHGENFANWFDEVLQYNIPKGKLVRGLFTVYSYEKLIAPVKPSPENLKLSCILGWILEIHQSLCLMWDDLMDASQTRRGQPCWYTIDGVGLRAVKDGLLIKSEAFTLLKKYFSDKDCYKSLLWTFHEMTDIAAFGQLCDIKMSSKDVDSFNMETYSRIVSNKTSHFSFYIPVALAMALSGIKSSEKFQEVKQILLEIGHMFQAQDDFLDCFGDPKAIGKIGTDIEENKCTWLAVTAMEQSNDRQKAIMKECYGSSDPEKVNEVKKLYAELEIPKMFAEFERKSYESLEARIQTTNSIPRDIFYHILNKTYRRKF